ncbi:MAG: lipoyl synthase [Bacteroidales bacterium]
MIQSRRKPEWLKIKIPKGQTSFHVRSIIHSNHLNTICTSGRCPNQAECWSCGTATFMIGGNICTRNCRFCNVTTGKPLPLDSNEPQNVAASIAGLKLKHAVITSVDRDDLPDYGASHWVKVITAIKEQSPMTTMEVLIPDFQGNLDLVDRIIEAEPDVISHNLETVRSLSDQIRCKATYETSLAVIKRIADSGIVAKSGIMLGLGELPEEIIQTMDDLRSVGCEVMTIGQYLQPAEKNIEVKEYIHPDQFEEYRQIALNKGFRHVESAPLVRSSYHAERHVRK